MTKKNIFPVVATIAVVGVVLGVFSMTVMRDSNVSISTMTSEQAYANLSSKRRSPFQVGGFLFCVYSDSGDEASRFYQHFDIIRHDFQQFDILRAVAQPCELHTMGIRG